VITRKKIKKKLDFFLGGITGRLAGSGAGTVGIELAAGITGFIGLDADGKGFGVTGLGAVMIKT